MITSVHLGTAWAADGGSEDAGADASTTSAPTTTADGGDDQADGGADDYTSCGAKRADRGNGMFLFGTGCC